MPWHYSQRSGRITSPTCQEYQGDSGSLPHRNNPSSEAIHSQGSIPQGSYRIDAPRNSPNTGPHVMDLAPIGHNAHGRRNLQIHGDSRQSPGNASNGCIVLDRNVRNAITQSGDTQLIVRE